MSFTSYTRLQFKKPGLLLYIGYTYTVRVYLPNADKPFFNDSGVFDSNGKTKDHPINCKDKEESRRLRIIYDIYLNGFKVHRDIVGRWLTLPAPKSDNFSLKPPARHTSEWPIFTPKTVFAVTLQPKDTTKKQNISQKRYTVTIYAAAPGTPLKSGGVSTPGHLFYTTSTSDGGELQSFGFAPVTKGDMYGPGDRWDDDIKQYQNPFYARTMEVTAEQYEKLNAFGKKPEDYGFSKTYSATNNCVDYTWSALRHAGINASTDHAKTLNWIGIKYEGRSVPLHNVDAIKSIPAPLPESKQNQEKNNPLPDLDWWQKPLTENKAPSSPNDAMPA